jgi:hypothetical protein
MKVSVYYETLCGDSKRFIKTQLYPVKKSSLGQYFDVELVPYGKAMVKKTQTYGTITYFISIFLFLQTTSTSDSYIFSCQVRK